MSRPLLLAAAALLLLSACGGADGDAGTPTDPGEQASPDAPTNAGGAEVSTASTDLGTVLVDGEGRTLYRFDNDREGESACYDGCAQTWPPLLGEPSASGEADASLLGTIVREDGSTQVTYAGWPLYLYAADTAPGDVQGQGVGDAWWVVAPDGTPVTEAAAGSGGASGAVASDDPEDGGAADDRDDGYGY